MPLLENTVSGYYWKTTLQYFFQVASKCAQTLHYIYTFENFYDAAIMRYG